mmetsp:Transcript_14895/g.32416  ORF Transcript_14895/g.32416 Transcript_14895/m.32416 type:complete len:209 (+) Transcript_14895:606-1232(+)
MPSTSCSSRPPICPRRNRRTILEFNGRPMPSLPRRSMISSKTNTTARLPVDSPTVTPSLSTSCSKPALVQRVLPLVTSDPRRLRAYSSTSADCSMRILERCPLLLRRLALDSVTKLPHVPVCFAYVSSAWVRSSTLSIPTISLIPASHPLRRRSLFSSAATINLVLERPKQSRSVKLSSRALSTTKHLDTLWPVRSFSWRRLVWTLPV